MDFYRIKETRKKDTIIIYPDFVVKTSNDLLTKGGNFYAIWDQENGIWSTDELDVARLIDEDLRKRAEELDISEAYHVEVRWATSYGSKVWEEYKKFVKAMPDSKYVLDMDLTFSNDKPDKKKHASKRLPYFIEEGPAECYEEIISTLYDNTERDKIEWAIGAILSGDAKNIQKFIVFYGSSGTGKSTIMNIILELFQGYYAIFDAKALVSTANQFSTEVFRSNPLVAVQQDGDLSKIEDNTKLNSIVSHEEIIINEKHKKTYPMRINAFLFMGTNKPVKITDAKSGIVRRLIDVTPSGRLIEQNRYVYLTEQIKYELGAIANHCLKRYKKMGRHYYDSYVPLNMIYKTDVFFNFVESNFDTFKRANGITLKQAYDIYKEYCDESLVEFKLPMYRFREELKNYFEIFEERGRIDGIQCRSIYRGFRTDKFTLQGPVETKSVREIQLSSEGRSAFDELFAECPAQYAGENGNPRNKWDKVKTKLKDLDTTKLHWVMLPENIVCIDFDFKNEKGEKDLEKNIQEASKFPRTYAEVSKSGGGIHLYYDFKGDSTQLDSRVSSDIEIKVCTGKSACRRKLSLFSENGISKISSGLPLKGEEKKVLNTKAVENEKALRTIIIKNLNKEYHGDTRSSIDFINKVLTDAYNSGLKYDVTDLWQDVLVFASNSTNQSDYCLDLVMKMPFKSDEPSRPDPEQGKQIAFFDIECFPNLFMIRYKLKGEDLMPPMFNPSPQEIPKLFQYKLVGYNNRRYDNHMIYAAYLGYNNEALYQLSKMLIETQDQGRFGEAYNLSYTDVYDFCSEKKSLKKWEIELGIHHSELNIPFDKPVPRELWDKVAEYCGNDVIATEAVFDARHADYEARLILAELSGLTPNDTTRSHATKIIFGDDKNPQKQFVYTDLSEMFPGYKYENGKSTYRGYEVGEGGRVYAEPGIYWNVKTFDVASMHPTSIEQLNLFGKYTPRFSELKAARIAIKHKDIETAKKMLEGKLAPFLEEGADLSALSYALKIIINMVYGFTCARFPNEFKDPRNIDNIVAKRGALFMTDLQLAVQELGYQVVHIKTDSIKIANPDDFISEYIIEFGKRYGYEFEVESEYERMALVNNAVYIARDFDGKWHATGAQFAHPYVFKYLFSHEPISFNDLCETKEVKTEMYLDFNENEKDDLVYVGRIGRFCPVKKGTGGGQLLVKKSQKVIDKLLAKNPDLEEMDYYNSVTGTKDFRWKEAELVKELKIDEDIDYGYFDELVREAVATIQSFGDAEEFIGVFDEEDYVKYFERR